MAYLLGGLIPLHILFYEDKITNYKSNLQEKFYFMK